MRVMALDLKYFHFNFDHVDVDKNVNQMITIYIQNANIYIVNGPFSDWDGKAFPSILEGGLEK